MIHDSRFPEGVASRRPYGAGPVRGREGPQRASASNGAGKIKDKGLGLVELIIVMGISALLIFSFSQIILLSNMISRRTEDSAQALRLAEETLEAARIFRNRTNWTSGGLGILTIGSPYHPEIISGDWQLVSGEETIKNSFIRFLRLERVYRDANDNIAETGTEDPNSRKVTAIVRGAGATKIAEIKLTTYLMNWK